jgi:heat shock protein HslJ
MLPLFLSAAVLLAGYLQDETLSGFAQRDAVYVLEEIDGAPPPGQATIRFPATGAVTGEGPCNRYSAAQTAPYPWFAIGPIAATRRACPDLAFEAVFFEALTEMSLADALGPVLILSNDAGREMVFRAAQD